ncbi:MAG: ATP-dependent DNA ligase [Nitrospirae bacterium]|nr:ATP-dependent DNA ligase [Candidatus Troglogloeales bacterium]
MKCSRLVSYFERLEITSKRLELFSILADLFKEVTVSEIDKVIYLLQGELLPPFHGINIGMAEKYLLRAIAKSGDIDANDLLKKYRQIGDIGKTAERFCRGAASLALTVSEVYDAIYQIAVMGGEGSVDQKIDLLSSLFSQLSPVEAKYVARFVAGKLRLGVGDATLLEALALSKGERAFRASLDRAYHLTSDLGRLAKIFYQSGKDGIAAISVRLGFPIRPALCERLSSPDEIIEKIGPCVVEIKYDGFRCQAHKRGNDVILFSRNQERTTPMFPEIVEAIQTIFAGQEVILEGEALAVNLITEELFSFQVTMQRKRKHNINEMAKNFPLKFFVFDLLYLNGIDYTHFSYTDRRKKLAELIPKNQVITLAESVVTEDTYSLSRLFNETVERGLEGLVAKRPDAPYTAGARNFNWIKLKRSYKRELTDSLDLCIVGYYTGYGHRTKFGIGTILTAVYDKEEGCFKTVSKIGTGFSEQELIDLSARLSKIISHDKPREVDSEIVPDVWVMPKYLVTVTADEITRSQNHTAGRDATGAGYALRFPRVVGFIREDKGPYDATDVSEVISLFNMQKQVKME